MSRKKAFQISTNYHPNAEFGQAEIVRSWLVSVLANIARNNPVDEKNQRGPTVTVIVEVLDE